LSGLPDEDFNRLKRNSKSVSIAIFQGRNDRYLPTRISYHRHELDTKLRVESRAFSSQEYRCFEGEEYPLDLSQIQGIWLDPLSVAFNHLQVIDIDVMVAAYWIIPIVTSASVQSLRRIIFRNTDDYSHSPFPLPLRHLDLLLWEEFPAVKVILDNPTTFSWDHFKENMRLLYHHNRLGKMMRKGVSVNT
jgi:hypothetical protein